MKKEILKSLYELQILNDGSSIYNWIHPLKSRIMVRPTDISVHPIWNEVYKKEEVKKNDQDQNSSPSETDSFDSGNASD
jgi:hypothetical protein